MNDNIFINTHPIVQDRLTKLRNKATRPKTFRACLNDIAFFLAVDATAYLPTYTKTIETPLQETEGQLLVETNPLIVPILRAGLALSESLHSIIPNADVGHIGLYRDHDTHLPVEYLNKLPSDLNRPIFVVDPMLATGNSMVKTLDILMESGAKESDITVITLLCAPEGIKQMRKKYNHIRIFTAAVDDLLNNDAYIAPGLGDAGDRYFGTE
jgi:uracil phosphoribosyltransferase